jgi:hypothetical protein
VRGREKDQTMFRGRMNKLLIEVHESSDDNQKARPLWPRTWPFSSEAARDSKGLQGQDPHWIEH